MLQIYSLKESICQPNTKAVTCGGVIHFTMSWRSLPPLGTIFFVTAIKGVEAGLAKISKSLTVLHCTVYICVQIESVLLKWDWYCSTDINVTTWFTSTQKVQEQSEKTEFFFKISGNQHKFGRFQTINVCSCFFIYKSSNGTKLNSFMCLWKQTNETNKRKENISGIVGFKYLTIIVSCCCKCCYQHCC